MAHKKINQERFDEIRMGIGILTNDEISKWKRKKNDNKGGVKSEFDVKA